jgi:hypothetical protein
MRLEKSSKKKCNNIWMRSGIKCKSSSDAWKRRVLQEQRGFSEDEIRNKQQKKCNNIWMRSGIKCKSSSDAWKRPTIAGTTRTDEKRDGGRTKSGRKKNSKCN